MTKHVQWMVTLTKKVLKFLKVKVDVSLHQLSWLYYYDQR